jgi:hypothetical protein
VERSSAIATKANRRFAMTNLLRPFFYYYFKIAKASYTNNTGKLRFTRPKADSAMAKHCNHSPNAHVAEKESIPRLGGLVNSILGFSYEP